MHAHGAATSRPARQARRVGRTGGRGRIGAWAAVIALLCAAAAPARALPVSFDGPSGFGLTRATAETARDTAGIPWLVPSFLGDLSGTLAVVFPADLSLVDPGNVTPNPPTAASNNRATVPWQVQNVSQADLPTATYLVFFTSQPRSAGGVTVSYDDANVGIDIAAADGWVILRAFDGALGELFYPAIRVSPLGSQQITSFDLRHVVDQPLQLNAQGDFELPQLVVDMAIAPVPEPGSALLFAIGLLGLAARVRQRP